MSKQFEQRFEGKSNAGLRAAIREVVERTRRSGGSGKAIERAILMFGDTVALSTSGKLRMAEVAKDYREAASASSSKHWAAIGDNGLEPVVWGVGLTEAAALADAKRWLRESGSRSSLRAAPITEKRYQAIKAGDVSAKGL